MAAALSFHTIFSLLPTFVVMLVVLQSFRGLEEYAQRFQDTVIETVLPETLIQGDEARPADGGEGDDAAAASDALRAREEFLQARSRLASRLRSLIQDLSQINFGGIGVVGLLLLIYGATALFTTIERSFNAILGISRGRPWFRRLALYYTLITLGPFVLIAGQIMQREFAELLVSGGWSQWTDWLTGPMVVLSPILTSWLVFFLLYVLLPTARVRRRSAAVGSLVAAVLWVIAKELFSVYVRHGGISTVYGALALVPLFLLWVWVAWMIVLFGLELTDTLQSMRSGELEDEHRGRERPLVDAALVVGVAGAVASGFREGRPVELEGLSQTLGLPRSLVGRLLLALEEAQIVLRVEESEGVAWSLARPAETIAIRDLLAAAEHHLLVEIRGDAATETRLAAQLRAAQREAAADATLADALADAMTEPS